MGSWGGAGGIQRVLSLLLESLVRSEESWPRWLVSTAHVCDAAMVTHKPWGFWGARPQWKEEGQDQR